MKNKSKRKGKKMKAIKKIILVMTAAVMIVSAAACGSTDNSNSKSQSQSQSQSIPADQAETTQTEAFPKFKGKDFDGNDVDDSLFSKNEATLLTFWFNGCSACVNEMPALEKFNAKLREKGAELIGVNVQAGENQEEFNGAKEILSKQGVTYRNIVIDDNQDARSYIAKIFTFPTTILVDKHGNIVGQPIVGSIEDEEKMNQILKMVDDLKAGKDISSSATPHNSGDDKTSELLAEENMIFSEHRAVWDKVFAKIQKDKVQQNENTPYVEFLKSQIEESKDSFSEDELRTLDDDLKKIEEIEAQIQELGKK